MSTYNYLPENTFQIKFKDLPNLEFYCQEVLMPQIQMTNTDVQFPGIDLKVPGDKIVFGSLDVTFIVDEEMKNYIEVFNWIKDQRPGSGTEYTGLTSDIFLHVNTANSTPNKVIQFTSAFPSLLGNLTFRSNVDTIQYMTCTATFEFTEFKFL